MQTEKEWPSPFPFLAGSGRLLVYAGPTWTERIVNGRALPVFRASHVTGLATGGGNVLTTARVDLPGDGCGCLDAPAWSTDGSRIAVLEGNFASLHSKVHVAVMKADGSGRHALVTTTSHAEIPGLTSNSLSWSPDGTRIAYDGAGPAGDEIGIVKADGSGHSLIGQGSSPAWSPDGTKIAFIRQSIGSYSGIFVMNPDGTGIHELAHFGAQGLAPGLAWSPDGSRIAFSLNGGAELMNADGSNIHPLSFGYANGDEPSWSPDGTQTAWQESSSRTIFVIGADGSGQRQLTHHGECCDHPSWSPDGKTLLFAGLGNELYLIDAGGGKVRPLSFTRPPRKGYDLAIHTQTGGLRSTFYLPLQRNVVPDGVALAGRIAAVGSQPGAAYRDDITLYNTHKRIASVTVNASHSVNHSVNLSLAGADHNWVVFQLGNTLRALNVHSHRVIRLTTPDAHPLDLSVSGRQVAWAENNGGHGRILALDLPS